MSKLIDFSFQDDLRVRHAGLEVPEHTQEALENYFIRGYEPGGFLTSCLTGDLYHAVRSADTANCVMLYAIVRWIMHNAPEGSWGSTEAMRDWIADRDGHRSAYREQQEKARTWLTLVK